METLFRLGGVTTTHFEVILRDSDQFCFGKALNLSSVSRFQPKQHEVWQAILILTAAYLDGSFKGFVSPPRLAAVLA